MANRSDWKNYKKPPSEDLKKDLTPLQYEVTQKEGTEKPFKNEYWNHHEEGLYVDRLSGEPLFSSKHKFDSGTGWPSFTQPLLPEQLILKEDRRLFSVRTEVRSKLADSHLGHVFKDGPPPTGLRYCINSASLRFIPLADLEKFGYGEFLTHFTPSPQPPSKDKGNTNKREPSTLASSTATTEKAILAGGCFWGMEELIREQPGVVATQVGYTGGTLKNPTYETVKTGNTGHAEAIEVEFDPKKTSYRKILKFFFRIHDPTTLNQQGHDKGSQYRSAIFYLNKEQKTIADMIKTEEENSGRWNNKPIVTQITPASTFFEAEDYHQDYLKKNPGGYTCHYVRE